MSRMPRLRLVLTEIANCAVLSGFCDVVLGSALGVVLGWMCGAGVELISLISIG